MSEELNISPNVMNKRGFEVSEIEAGTRSTSRNIGGVVSNPSNPSMQQLPHNQLQTQHLEQNQNQEQQESHASNSLLLDHYGEIGIEPEPIQVGNRMMPVPLPTPVPIPVPTSAPVSTSAPVPAPLPLKKFKFKKKSDAPGTVFQHQFGGIAGAGAGVGVGAGAGTFVDSSGGISSNIVTSNAGNTEKRAAAASASIAAALPSIKSTRSPPKISESPAELLPLPLPQTYSPLPLHSHPPVRPNNATINSSTHANTTNTTSINVNEDDMPAPTSLEHLMKSIQGDVKLPNTTTNNRLSDNIDMSIYAPTSHTSTSKTEHHHQHRHTPFQQDTNMNTFNFHHRPHLTQPIAMSAHAHTRTSHIGAYTTNPFTGGNHNNFVPRHMPAQVPIPVPVPPMSSLGSSLARSMHRMPENHQSSAVSYHSAVPTDAAIPAAAKSIMNSNHSNSRNSNSNITPLQHLIQAPPHTNNVKGALLTIPQAISYAYGHTRPPPKEQMQVQKRMHTTVSDRIHVEKNPRRKLNYSMYSNPNYHNTTYLQRIAQKKYKLDDPLPTADEIAKAIPSNASSIFHIFDRRIDLDALSPNASLYSLLRRWVQDDPYRKEALEGPGRPKVDFMDYIILPSQRRNVTVTDDTKFDGDHGSDSDSEEIEGEDIGNVAKEDLPTCNVLDSSAVNASCVIEMKQYLKGYIERGSKRRKKRNKLLKKQDNRCLKRLKKELGIKMKAINTVNDASS